MECSDDGGGALGSDQVEEEVQLVPWKEIIIAR